MAATDYLSSTPVRSEADGVDAKVIVKIVDGTVGGSNEVSVDNDKNLHIEMHGNNPVGTDVVMRLSEEGAPNGDGLYDPTNNTTPNTAGITAQTRNAAYSDTRQSERPTAIRGTTANTAVSLDVALHDEAGEAYSQTNPMPVAISNVELGTPVHLYSQTATSIAANGGTQTIDYTVATSTLTLLRLVMSGSGRLKVDVFTGNATTPDQKYTLFNAANNNNILLDIPRNFTVAVADIVRVVFTNEDKAAFTGYLTLEGMQ